MTADPIYTRPKLSQGEIQARLAKFATDHARDGAEMRDYATFWDELFRCYGTIRQEVAIYQYAVPKMSGTKGAIDLLWKQKLLVEHKSHGKDLDAAYLQAHDYMAKLPDYERPNYVVICDFKHFRLFDVQAGTREDFTLGELPEKWHLLGFIGGYVPKGPANDDDVDFAAVALLSELYDELASGGYPDHQLQRFLVRVLFCLFAEDTAIFPRDAFGDFVRYRSNEDGTDLGLRLEQFFRVLNMPDGHPQRQGLEASLAGLPYINGGLFADHLDFANTTAAMRRQLLACTQFDWSRISPAIFGSLFQGVIDSKERRALGAHYTSESNILKLIKPLFLDDLRAQLDAALADKSQRKISRLTEFHQRLGALKFLDPACGCGNFLVISYRELRRLEHEVLLALYGNAMAIDVGILSRVRVSQFCGIEIEEFPSEIARVAMWLMDHVMNRELSAAFGRYFVRLPLTDEAHIVHGNALRLDWNTVLKVEACAFVLGNPPFIGKHYQNQAQKADLLHTFGAVRAASDLDYVACWYRCAAGYMSANPGIRGAFVSSNSITQGEQVGILWSELQRLGVQIHFAHRTFPWSSEARGKAAVHCVIIGFGLQPVGEKWLFEYEHGKVTPEASKARNINPYLADAPSVIAMKRQGPLGTVPLMKCGNKPSDGGNLLLSPAERVELLRVEPGAGPWIRPFVGSEEFINSSERWCLWLDGISPAVLRKLPHVLARVEAVRQFRLKSTAAPTRKMAELPARFFFVSQPACEYILVPEVSSERRRYVPIGLVPADVISSNKNYLIADSSLCLFGILQSAMHMLWLGAVGGRLESRYQYSASMVYNTFPWPDSTDAQKTAISAGAQAVLDARAAHPGASLADLYDPLAMPADLVKAHQALDRAVERAYRAQAFRSDRERVEYLFTLYEQLTAPLAPSAAPAKAPRKARSKQDPAADA